MISFGSLSLRHYGKWLLAPLAASLFIGCDSQGLHAGVAVPAQAATIRAVSLQQVVWPPIRPVKLVMASRVPADFPKREIDTFLSHLSSADGIWGVSVVDPASQRLVYESKGDYPMRPASTAKLLTTSFALDVLGPNATFSTQALTAKAPGPDGVLKDPVVLLGGGDPNLSARIFPFQVKTRYGVLSEPFDRLADQLWNNGVRAVPAGLVADTRRYPQEPPPAGWTSDDLVHWYGAPVSSLSYNDEMVFVSLRPGRRIGQPAIVSMMPDPSGLIRNDVVTGRYNTPIRLVDRGGFWELQGTISLRSGAASLRLPQPDPARMAIMAFRDALVRRGIQVGSSIRILRRRPDQPLPSSLSYAHYSLVGELKSPPLREAVMVVNKVSQNLHAEILLREASLALGGNGSRAQAEALLRTWLKQNGLMSRESHLADGCGLSRDYRVTPTMLASVLSFGYRSPWGGDWRASLPVAGVDGTLRHRFMTLGSQVSIQAKTGTLDGVATLAGYIRKTDGHTYAFSVMVNDYRASEWHVRTLIDRLVDLIATSPAQGPTITVKGVGEAY